MAFNYSHAFVALLISFSVSVNSQTDIHSTADSQPYSTPSPPSTPSPIYHRASTNWQEYLIVGAPFGAMFIMLTLTGIWVMRFLRRQEAEDEDTIQQLPGMLTKFTIDELRAATENFVKILGKGGFGTVFEGRWGDERIAVKRLDNVGYGKNNFLAEVQTIGSIHHINLVRMIDFCANKLDSFLVYEYVCKGSLDQ